MTTYHLTLHVSRATGSICTHLYAEVRAFQSQEDDIDSRIVWQRRRELVWDEGQPASIRIDALKAVERFCEWSGVTDPF